MQYIQSGGGYFYKKKVNGNKIRISKDEYCTKMKGGG